MKKYLFVFLVLICSYAVNASKYRAGEITYKHINGFTYEFTLHLYTDSAYSLSDSLLASWGDSSFDTLSLIGTKFVNDSSIVCRTYGGTHTYSGSGTYKVSIEIPNRPGGIVNIPGSINIPFYIETYLTINSFLGANNSPDFTNPAIAKGNINNIVAYNPNAVDLDGDSISYKLVDCRGLGGFPIGGYSLPLTNNLFVLDSITGNLIWDSPIVSGDYNVAILIEEWRQGIKIGSIIRDIQLQIGSNISSIKDNPENFEITVFPNPTQDYLFVKQKQSTNENLTIELFDITGKMLIKDQLNIEQSIYIGELAKGIYVLRLTNDKETLEKRIIKQ